MDHSELIRSKPHDSAPWSRITKQVLLIMLVPKSYKLEELIHVG